MYSFVTYSPLKLQIQKDSNKDNMVKKPNMGQNFKNFIIHTKHILFLWNFVNRSAFYYSIVFQVSF
jgi:hypothetical protein